MARAIRGWPGSAVGPEQMASVDPWVARHHQTIRGCRAIHGWPGPTVGPEQDDRTASKLRAFSHPGAQSSGIAMGESSAVQRGFLPLSDVASSEVKRLVR